MFPTPKYTTIDELRHCLKTLEDLAKQLRDHSDTHGLRGKISAFLDSPTLYLDILWLKWFIWRGKPITVKRLLKFKSMEGWFPMYDGSWHN